MKFFSKIPLIAIILTIGTSCHNGNKAPVHKASLTFEKINYYKPPRMPDDKPFQSRLTYYFDNGKPHRWMLLDSLGMVVTDYIYQYDSTGLHIGAHYREDRSIEFSIEKVRYRNDSTKVTEWVDSTGIVYYTMVDDLNKDKKTYRAEFIGDRTHGFDSTFYTKEGFEKRIFFTNTKGKIFNDRSYLYDSINPQGDWAVRKKIMNDTVSEIHFRELYYDSNYVSLNRKYYEGVVSSGEWSENVISFSRDTEHLLFTRTSDWIHQQAYLSKNENGLFTEPLPIKALDSIYNGALSPNGDKILYSIRKEDKVEVWLAKYHEGKWNDRVNLTAVSGVQGGYFYWFSESEIYFQSTMNNGDIVKGILEGDSLSIQDNLAILNTAEGTEFSPYLDPDRRFMIFTRYLEGNEQDQGFFISNNSGSPANPQWNTPEKIYNLPYGWSGCVIDDGSRFIFSDGEDIYSIALDALDLKL